MRRKHIRRKLNGKGYFAILILFLLLGVVLFRLSLVPVLRDSAENEARRFAVSAMNEAVDAVLSEHRSWNLTSIEEDGTVMTNTYEMNRLKEEIVQQVNQTLRQRIEPVTVPLGTLLGNEWFYARGPEIPLRILLSGNAEGAFKSDFSAAGINQTCYRLSLVITADLYTFLPGVRGSVPAETEVLLAERVYAGDVPSFFAGTQ